MQAEKYRIRLKRYNNIISSKRAWNPSQRQEVEQVSTLFC